MSAIHNTWNNNINNHLEIINNSHNFLKTWNGEIRPAVQLPFITIGFDIFWPNLWFAVKGKLLFLK